MSRVRKLRITINRLSQLLNYGFLADEYKEAIRQAIAELSKLLENEEE